jgi:hypothetical protein
MLNAIRSARDETSLSSIYISGEGTSAVLAIANQVKPKNGGN